MASPKSPAFAIVDDHPAVAAAISEALARNGKFRCVGAFTSVASARDGLPRTQPEIIITDWRLADGVASMIVAAVRSSLPHAKWLLFTAWPKPAVLRSAIAEGIRSCVSKSAAYGDLVKAVELVHAGETYYCPESLRAVLKLIDNATPVAHLSATDREVLRLVAEGLEPKQIADRLKLRLKTVHNSLAAIRQKAALTSMVQLAKFAVDEGLAPPV